MSFYNRNNTIMEITEFQEQWKFRILYVHKLLNLQNFVFLEFHIARKSGILEISMKNANAYEVVNELQINILQPCVLSHQS